MQKAQEKLIQFDKARGWDKGWHLKDLCLNIIEEVGEFWNLIKWIDSDKQKEIIKEKKEEASDFIGDSLFLVLKLANKMDVDASKALQNTLDEYEKRMPPEKIKQFKHANKYAGGYDNKNNLN